MDQQPLIEGKHFGQDLSNQWVDLCTEIKKIEEGIPLLEWIEKAQLKNTAMEFRLIRRLTESQYHNAHLKDFDPNINSMNRYGNIVPYKHTNVIIENDLQETDNNVQGECAGYINASWLTTCMNDKKAFIATQGPLPNTIENFWKMVWQNNISNIFMLCQLNENQKVQCDQYWPNIQDEKQITGNLLIKIVNEENVDGDKNLRLRKFSLQKGDEIKKVHQYQLLTWPDHQIPKEEDDLLLKLLVDILVKQYYENSISIVHCSAGIGRSGTLITMANIRLTLDYFENQLKQFPDNKSSEELQSGFKLSIFGLVRRLREQRWGMVHTTDQYKYLYKYAGNEIQKLLNSFQPH